MTVSFNEIRFRTAVPGVNLRFLLFNPAPLIRARHAFPNHVTEDRCWAFSPPPPDLLPRMLVISMGMAVRAETPSAMRRSWPPPSRVVPSRWTGEAILVYFSTR